MQVGKVHGIQIIALTSFYIYIYIYIYICLCCLFLRRGQDASHDRNQKDGRDREKEDRRGRRDESREGLGPMGGQGKERDRMDDRQRRMMGAGGGPAAQMVSCLPLRLIA